MKQSHIDYLAELNTTEGLENWNDQLTRSVQSCLVELKYLGSEKDIDGIPGDRTRQAWAEFKTSVHMKSPSLIGAGSARALLDALHTTHPPIAEPVPQHTNINAGKRSGAYKRLPYYQNLVFENEFIIPGIPLTWGECTRGLTRWPTHKMEVDNAKNLARVFGQVRQAFADPIAVTSGFRPEPINSSVGGVRGSQHTLFKALDLHPLNGKFDELLYFLRHTSGVGGIGKGKPKNFHHMDIRSYRVEWDY